MPLKPYNWTTYTAWLNIFILFQYSTMFDFARVFLIFFKILIKGFAIILFLPGLMD